MIKFAICSKCKYLWTPIFEKWTHCACGNVSARINGNFTFPNSMGFQDFELELKMKDSQHGGDANVFGITDLAFNASQFPASGRTVTVTHSERVKISKPDFKIGRELEEIVFTEQTALKVIPNEILHYQRSEGVFCIYSMRDGANDVEVKLNGYLVKRLMNEGKVKSLSKKASETNK